MKPKQPAKAVRFLAILLVALLLSLTGKAQIYVQDTMRPAMDRAPRWVLKVAPLNFFDPYGTIQFGAERVLSRRHTVQGELGYGWNGINLYSYQREQLDRMNVWRGKAEWRLYSGRYRSGRRPHFSDAPLGNYFAVEAFFKQTSIWQMTSIGRECESGNCAYFERGSFPTRRTIWGGHLKFGRQFVMSMSDDNRLVMDFFLGLGVRGVSDLRPMRTSEFGIFRPSIPFSISNRGGLRPSLALGFKLGYVL